MRILHNADAIIALSDEWRDCYKNVFGNLNYYVLKNGVDTEAIQEANSDPYMVSNAFLFLGRLGKMKGVYDLVDALFEAKKMNPNIYCYFA